MNKMALLPFAAFAAACAPAAPIGPSNAEQAELNAALRGYVSRGTVDCVSQRDLRSNRSIGEVAILFEGRGNTLYVNRPPAGCPDLRESRALITQTPSTRLCRGDIASVVDMSSGMTYGSCGLGSFTVYEKAS